MLGERLETYGDPVAAHNLGSGESVFSDRHSKGYSYLWGTVGHLCVLQHLNMGAFVMGFCKTSSLVVIVISGSLDGGIGYESKNYGCTVRWYLENSSFHSDAWIVS